MAYSEDLRSRVIEFVEKGNSKTIAAEQFGVSRAIVFVWCQTPEKTSAEKPGPKGSWKMNLKTLQALVEKRPDSYQHELAKALGVTRQNVSLGLKKLKLSRKKTMLYEEKDDNCRKLFLENLVGLDPATLVYVDECGVESTLQREYGYCTKGKRLAGKCSGNRGERQSIIAGLLLKKVLAPWIFNGYCDTDFVSQWLKEGLIPQLKPGMTVIWDNAAFHKRADLKALIEAAGCQLLFLPTYSPDLNPIEHLWAELKAWLRRLRCPLLPFQKLLDLFFLQSHKLLA